MERYELKKVDMSKRKVRGKTVETRQKVSYLNQDEIAVFFNKFVNAIV